MAGGKVKNGLRHEQSDDDEEDDVPLAQKISVKKEEYSSDEDKELIHKQLKKQHDRKRKASGDDSPGPSKSKKRKKHNDKPPTNSNSTQKKKPAPSPNKNSSPVKRVKTEEPETWKWWEEQKRDDGSKWHTLEHKGPVFAAPYEPLPNDVHFYYDGKPMKLSEPTEEVAGFYSRMLDHEYTTKDIFNKNFYEDWHKVMNESERKVIKHLNKCDFKELYEYYKRKSEERKCMSKEEKQQLKEANAATQNEYGFCILDGHRQKIANFKIEPPGLFRGRGNHPKMGMLKRRLMPEDIIINCSKGSKVPEPPAGRKWKEVRHDNTVTWLACWIENVQNNFKYVMLNASSRLKGEKDWKKYETARKLHHHVDKIRDDYRRDFKSKEMRVRQRAVALYFIDKLALRAGNEKDEDEADTVGCCSLRYEHIRLHDQLNGKTYVVEFDFLGKDSIRYQNAMPVIKRVYKNLKLFMKNKQDGDDLFDRLNTTILNQYLRELMDGLTAKVFRTYNASRTLEEQLELLTKPEDNATAKLLAYNRANRAVAVLCNHQRAVPKTFAKSMENLQKKIDSKKDQIKEITHKAKMIKAEYKQQKSSKKKEEYEKLKKQIHRQKDMLEKLQVQATDKDENKEIALSTSKLNYLDPRITIAWCKHYAVPIEKVYNKTQREKFQWAIDMTTDKFKFLDVDSDRSTNKLQAAESEEDEDDNQEED